MIRMSAKMFLAACVCAMSLSASAEEPTKGDTQKADLGSGITLETVYIPPGEFKMGSTPEEKKWATGIEGGAQLAPNASHTKVKNLVR